MEIIKKYFNLDKGLNIKASGKIDIETAVEYGTTVKDLLDDIEELVLDFSEITYVSSIGLRVILELHQQMVSQEGQMRLINVQEPVAHIFKMTGFDKFLNIVK